MKVAIVVFDGFDGLDAIAPHDAFANAGLMGGDCDGSLVACEATDSVRTSHRSGSRPDSLFADARLDLLWVPGGGWTDGGGDRDVVEAGAPPHTVAELDAAGTRVASVCTGTKMLATAGHLEGWSATIHPATSGTSGPRGGRAGCAGRG